MVSATNRVIAVIENYPDLKGTENFLLLQTQLEGSERRVKVARDDFNAVVANYNQTVRQFPSGMVARLFGFKPKEGFSAVQGSDSAPELKFK